jgi:hypothetical protein
MGTNEPECINCPDGKYQSLAGQPFCESVEEGLFVSDEPAEVLDQQLELPNQDGALSADVERALIEKLAEQLGIHPGYISLGGPVDSASRRRALATGLALTITILSDDSGALAATLSALTSDPSFWQGVNDRLAENNVTTTLDTSGIVLHNITNAGCNTNFIRNNVTGSCVAVAISCGKGTFLLQLVPVFVWIARLVSTAVRGRVLVRAAVRDILAIALGLLRARIVP